MITQMDRRLSVAVLETQPIMVEGIRATLTESRRYSLLEPVRTLEALNRLVASASPRIAMVDKACGAPALNAWLSACQRTPTAAVIWGSALSDAEALRFLNAGARGVLRKTADPETLVACLDAVSSGSTWMEESLFQHTLRQEGSVRSSRTPREHQIVALVEQGLRNKEIAERLGIQPGTVKIHLKHIFEKTGVRGRVGLALSSLREREQPTRLTA